MPKLGYPFTDAAEKGGLIPLSIDGGDKFYKHVYGVEMKKHILPFNTYNIHWKASEMKDYRKRIPNYLVVLVKKVLDGADEVAAKE